MKAVLDEAGASFADLVKITTYITDPRYRDDINPARLKYMGDNPPSSTLVVCAGPRQPGLPGGDRGDRGAAGLTGLRGQRIRDVANSLELYIIDSEEDRRYGRQVACRQMGHQFSHPYPQAYCRAGGVCRKAPPSKWFRAATGSCMRKETYNLADMLAEITDDNLHPEVDTGPPQGNEEW